MAISSLIGPGLSLLGVFIAFTNMLVGDQIKNLGPRVRLFVWVLSGGLLIVGVLMWAFHQSSPVVAIEVPGSNKKVMSRTLPYTPPAHVVPPKKVLTSNGGFTKNSTASADVGKKLAFIDEALKLNDEVQALGLPIGTRINNWRIRINADRAGLVADIFALYDECRVVENHFTDFRNRVEIFPDIRRTMDFGCYDYGKSLAEAKNTIAGLGDGNLSNPAAVVGDKMNDIPQQWGKIGDEWGQRHQKLIKLRTQLSR